MQPLQFLSSNGFVVNSLGRGHSRTFLLRKWNIFGNSVFPKSPGIGFSGIRYSRSGLLNFWDSRTTDKSWKISPKFSKKNHYFFWLRAGLLNFQDSRTIFKKGQIFLVFLFGNTEFSGFPDIFSMSNPKVQHLFWLLIKKRKKNAENFFQDFWY